MADFWIKIEKGTPDKPEILELSDILGMEDPDTVTGKMIRVWSWFDSNSENGHAPSVTKVLLDRVTGVPGFTDALVIVGWLNKTDDGFLIPNFDRHMGKGAKKRASDAERKRKSRECHSKGVTKPVTEKGLDKSRVDKSKEKILTSTKVDQLSDIFEFWKEVMNKNNSSILNAKRKSAISARLKEGYTVEQIKQAVIGCSKTPYNVGHNDSGKRYDDIELICRNGVNLERYANNANSSTVKVSGSGQSTMSALNNFEV